MSNPGLQNVRALTYAHMVLDSLDRGLQTDYYPQADEHIALFIARVRERIYRYLYGPRPAFQVLAPLSRILTIQVFVISTIWYLWVSQVRLPWLMAHLTSPWSQTIPLGISLDIYERHVRAIFPQLPSIRQKLLSLRTTVLAFFPKPPPESGASSSAASSHSHQGSQSTNSSVAPLPTLDVDLDAIRAGSS